MRFSQYAGTSIVPVLARIVLAAAFIATGFHKLFHEQIYEGEQAAVLHELGVGEPADVPAVQPVAWLAPPGPATADDDPADENPADENPADENPADENPAEAPPTTPPSGDDVDGVLNDFEDSDSDTAAADQPPDAAPDAVRARALHGVTLLLKSKGWPDHWQPVVMAWVAALTEFLGGGLILIGLFSRLWGLALAIVMAVAFWTTTWPAPIDPGLFRLAVGADGHVAFNRMFCQLGLFVLAFGVFLTGPGALSLDRVLFRTSRHHRALDEYDPGA